MDRVAALYRDHFAFVCRALRRAGVPAADIADLAHDVFVVIHRKLTGHDLPRSALATTEEERAWIHTIADLEAKNYRTRARFRRTEPMDDSTNEMPDARDEIARNAARDRLLLLLSSTSRERAAIFALVELEGYSVVVAARILDITETNARRRLEFARQDIKAVVAKLAALDEDTGKKKSSTFLLPFGVGAWCKFRDLMDPPAGTAERVWQRLQATIETMEQESDRPATPPPAKPPGRARAWQLLRKVAERLKGPLGYIVVASVGAIVGAIGALLLVLPRPNARIAILRIPGPVVVVTNGTTMSPPPLPGARSPFEAPPEDATIVPTADATTDEETLLIRRVRAAYATGNRQETIAALDAYDRRFPAGQFRATIHAIRAALTDADGR